MSNHTGSFLIAKPSLLDPNFRQSVVLLVQHNDEGAFGLVVNRPVDAPSMPCSVFSGGPCEAEGLFLIHGLDELADQDDEQANQIAPGIYLGNAGCAELIEDMSGDDLDKIRMYAGYAGWGPGQLERELSEDAWLLVQADGQTLFHVPAEDLWAHLRPPAIPQPSVN